MNWPVLIIVGIAAIALIIFLVVRNQTDEKEFEGHLKNDYRKTKNEEGDADPELPLK